MELYIDHIRSIGVIWNYTVVKQCVSQGFLLDISTVGSLHQLIAAGIPEGI